MSSKLRLGVNIDHVATIRNARGEFYPDPLRAALLAQNEGVPQELWFVLGGILLIFVVAVLWMFGVYGKLWFQAYMSKADVKLMSMVAMGFMKVNQRIIVDAKIRAKQSGLNITDDITTSRLTGHYLAGGNVMNVLHALIAAERAGIDLDLDRATAIDLLQYGWPAVVPRECVGDRAQAPHEDELGEERSSRHRHQRRSHAGKSVVLGQVERVVARAAVDRIRPAAGIEAVVARLAGHVVVPGAADDLVVAVPAVEPVVAVTAVEVVVAIVAVAGVVAVLAEQAVVVGIAEQPVVADAAVEPDPYLSRYDQGLAFPRPNLRVVS